MHIGSTQPIITVLINHGLPEGTKPTTKDTVAMTSDWREQIIQYGGNNWRKIFNVYAKLLFEIDPLSYNNWQSLRENELLTRQGNASLFCNQGDEFNEFWDNRGNQLFLITGKRCAEQLSIMDKLVWIDANFAQVEGENALVCPYFDYRQLSNIKIEQLAHLIQQRIK